MYNSSNSNATYSVVLLRDVSGCNSSVHVVKVSLQDFGLVQGRDCHVKVSQLTFCERLELARVRVIAANITEQRSRFWGLGENSANWKNNIYQLLLMYLYIVMFNFCV